MISPSIQLGGTTQRYIKQFGKGFLNMWERSQSRRLIKKAEEVKGYEETMNAFDTLWGEYVLLYCHWCMLTLLELFFEWFVSNMRTLESYPSLHVGSRHPSIIFGIQINLFCYLEKERGEKLEPMLGKYHLFLLISIRVCKLQQIW